MVNEPTSDPSREYLSVGDLARELHVTERFVRRLIADGELTAVRVGTRMVRIRRSDLGEVLHPVLAGSVR